MVIPFIKRKWLVLPFYGMLLMISVIFVLTQNVAFWRELFYQMTFDSFQSFLFVLSIFMVLLSLTLIFFSLLLWSKLRLLIVFLLLCFCTLFNYYSYYYQIYMDRDMLMNILETDSREALNLLSWKLFLWLLIGAITPIFLLMKVALKPTVVWKSLLHRILLIGVAFGVIGGVAFIFYKDYASFFRNHRQILKLTMPMSYIASALSYMEKSYANNLPFQVLAKDAFIESFEKEHKTVFVLVVGETARSQNFSLNGYSKETNPLLSEKEVISFRQVSSCGTATAVSVPCMFSVLTRENFNKNKALNQDNVLDILQKVGYQVLWRENDGGCKGVCDRLPTEFVENYLTNPQSETGLYYDEYLLTGLQKYILTQDQQRDLVIVLHMNGSHGPGYYQRYPDQFRVFQPSCDTNRIESCSTESLENVYDNTIIYTDYVLNKAIDILQSLDSSYETSLLYISDHGESLGEDRFYLHGAPYLIAPSAQTQVPMIFWGSQDFLKNRGLSQECLEHIAFENHYSHDNLFHTLLGILSVRTKIYDESMNIFKECQLL